MNKRILLVDDERSIRESLAKLLRAEDYEVEVADNGRAAIQKLGSTKCDLLLLDVGMPVQDGWATLEWLAEVNPDLPVILITGRFDQREHARQAGADALMEKPLDVPRLLATIGELVRTPEAPRARRSRPLRFRYEPCDAERFRDQLLERYTVPCAPPPATTRSGSAA